MPPLPRIVDYPHSPHFAPEAPTVLAGDGAINIDFDSKTLLTKGSAAAVTVAAPGAGRIGRRLLIMGGSDFAHVVTFTGSTLRDGTTGASVTWTSAAFQGSSLMVEAISATTWNVIANNLGVIA
jgi:hypothetical protein